MKNKEIPMLLIVSGKKGLEKKEEDEDEDEDGEKLEKALAKSKGLPPILLVSRK